MRNQDMAFYLIAAFLGDTQSWMCLVFLAPMRIRVVNQSGGYDGLFDGEDDTYSLRLFLSPYSFSGGLSVRVDCTSLEISPAR